MAEIIVIRYGQAAVEERCLGSVRKHTDLDQHTLTVIDNFERDRNLAAVWNEAIGASEEDWVCLLNTDTEVSAGWLDALESTGRRHDADAVGPMTDRCGIPQQKGIASSGVQEVSQLSGFCLLLRRKSWKTVGGFREDAPFYGQESLLLRHLKRKIINRSVFIHHEGGHSVTAEGRRDEERELARDFWNRNTRFDWGRRVAVLAGSGSPFPLFRGIDQAVTEFGREGMAIRNFPAHEVTGEELEAFEPDVAIVVNSRPSYIQHSRDALAGLRIPKGLWFNDAPREYPVEVMQGFDRFFTCFESSQETLGHEWSDYYRTPVTYMPQGSVIRTELEKLEIDNDVIFIGDVYGNKQWHSDRKSVVHEVRARVVNAWKRELRIEIEEQSPQLYRQANFALAMSPDIPGYTSLRLYNIMAYGGLALTRRFRGIERLFVHGKHCLFWGHVDDLRVVIRRFREQPRECERIRRRGWRFQQARHTVAMRLMNMVSALTTPDTAFWGYI